MRARTGPRCSTPSRRCPSARSPSIPSTGRSGSAPARRTPRRTPTPGTGVYRSTNDGSTWQRVGDDSTGNNPLVSHTVFRLAFDARGDAYAATNNGLFRLACRAPQLVRGARPGRRGRQPAVRPAGDRRSDRSLAQRARRHRGDRLARARQHRSSTASTSPPTVGHRSARSRRRARSTPATSAGPRSRTPPTAASSYAIVQSPAAQARTRRRCCRASSRRAAARRA